KSRVFCSPGRGLYRVAKARETPQYGVEAGVVGYRSSGLGGRAGIPGNAGRGIVSPAYRLLGFAGRSAAHSGRNRGGPPTCVPAAAFTIHDSASDGGLQPDHFPLAAICQLGGGKVPGRSQYSSDPGWQYSGAGEPKIIGSRSLQRNSQPAVSYIPISGLRIFFRP